MTATVANLFTENHRLDQIVPASRTSAETHSGWLSMRDYHKFTVILQCGALAANATVDLHIEQATDEVGTSAKDVTGKAITALGGSDDNKMAVIELDTSELDVTNQFDYVDVTLSVGGNAACLTSVLCIRHQPRFLPVDDTNLEEVVS